MKECTIKMPISIGLEKNSPLKPQMDKLLRRIIEAGLVSKWLSDSTQKLDFSDEEDTQDALITLKKLYGAVVALGIGCLFGLLAFLFELLCHWYLERKKRKRMKRNLVSTIVPFEFIKISK